MKTVRILGWVLVLMLLAASANAAPTLTLSVNPQQPASGQQVTTKIVCSLPAGDTTTLNSPTIKFATPKGALINSVTADKGVIENVASLEYDDETGTRKTVTSNTVQIAVPLAVPPPLNGVYSIPLGILAPGGNAATVTVLWTLK